LTPGELQSDLRAQGVILATDGDWLEFDAPSGVMTPMLLAMLRERKPELIQELRLNQEVGRQLDRLVEHRIPSGSIVLVHPDHLDELGRLGFLDGWPFGGDESPATVATNTS
jgi:hypothetical protein